MSNKSNKSNKNSKVSKAAAPVQTTSSDFGVRLSKSRGRIVGVTTVTGNKVRKFNGQIKSVSPQYITMFDRNQKRQVKFSRASILTVTGA